MNLRRLALAASLLLLAATPGVAEPPPGTKNFTPPASTPDYFSGEGGDFRGVAPRPASPAPAAAPTYAPRYAAPTYAAPTYAAPASRGYVQERAPAARRRVVYVITRHGNYRLDRRPDRREVSVRRRYEVRHEVRRVARVVERRHAVTVYRGMHSRSTGHRPAAHVHAATAGRRIARAGR